MVPSLEKLSSFMSLCERVMVGAGGYHADVVLQGRCLGSIIGDIGQLLRVMVARRLVQVEVAEDSDVVNE